MVGLFADDGQPFETRTQYDFVSVIGGVVKVAFVAPEIGEDVFGDAPSYHWNVRGVSPVALTPSVAV
jgi:hypothetical protein